MNQTKIPTYVYAAILLTALLSFFSIFKRNQVESENKAVAIAAEYETLESLAAAQGWTLERAIPDLKAQGLNALVLSEETVGEMIGQGRVSLVTAPGFNGKGSASALKFTDPTTVARVQRGLRTRFHDLAGRLLMRGDLMMLPPVDVQLVRTTPIGLNPQQAALAAKSGLLVIARHSNPSGASSKTIQETLGWSSELGAKVFLPQGDQVLGRRDALDSTIETLQSLNMLYASPEFAKIGGDEEVVQKAPEIVVRLHAAQAAELDKLKTDEAVDRYAKAARERNMRILLVRPLSFAADEPLSDYAGFLKQITQVVLAQGGKLGEPHPFREPNLPRFVQILIGFAIAPVVWFAVARFVVNRYARLVGAGLLAILALACATKIGQEVAALFGAMAFPIVAFYALDEFLSKSRGNRLATVLQGFLIVSAISLVGGLCVAGLLNGLPFYVKAAEFRAIRVAMFLPILVIGAHYFLNLIDWRAALQKPLTWGTIALSVAVVAALGLVLARSGNDSGIGASGGEIAFRGLLDRFLYVRPRTKEFLFGHPALMVAIGMLARTMQINRNSEGGVSASSLAPWTVLLLMLGAVGQTDVVNTLCHLHIPVMLSLARIAIGLALGCMLGLVAWAISDRLIPTREA